MKKEIKTQIALLGLGILLTTGSVWLFTYFTECQPQNIIILTCPNTLWVLPILCTLAWPFLIGLLLVLNAVNKLFGV